MLSLLTHLDIGVSIVELIGHFPRALQEDRKFRGYEEEANSYHHQNSAHVRERKWSGSAKVYEFSESSVAVLDLPPEPKATEIAFIGL